MLFIRESVSRIIFVLPELVLQIITLFVVLQILLILISAYWSVPERVLSTKVSVEKLLVLLLENLDLFVESMGKHIII